MESLEIDHNHEHLKRLFRKLIKEESWFGFFLEIFICYSWFSKFKDEVSCLPSCTLVHPILRRLMAFVSKRWLRCKQRLPNRTASRRSPDCRAQHWIWKFFTFAAVILWSLRIASEPMNNCSEWPGNSDAEKDVNSVGASDVSDCIVGILVLHCRHFRCEGI